MLVTWLKRKIQIKFAKSVRQDLARFVSYLRGGTDKEIGTLVAIATICRLSLTAQGLLPPHALELESLGDDAFSTRARLARLHRKLQKTNRPLDAVGVAVWLLTTRALACGEARELGREMWGELRRGFAYAEQSLAELEFITRVPAEARDVYNFIPPDLEPMSGREYNLSHAACEDAVLPRLSGPGAAEGGPQDRLDVVVGEYGQVADTGGDVLRGPARAAPCATQDDDVTEDISSPRVIAQRAEIERRRTFDRAAAVFVFAALIVFSTVAALKLALPAHGRLGQSTSINEADLAFSRYVRISPGDGGSAEISITPVGANRYYVTGLALWGEYRRDTHPVHMGELDFTADLQGNTLAHSEPYGDWVYRVVLRFVGDMLYVTEENWSGVHGFNVTFEGAYRRRL